MPVVRRTVSTRTAPGPVFAYLADFANATEWDSGTVSCHRVSGDGGPGTVYRNVSRFMGRTVSLDYTVEVRDEPTFVVVGRNATTVGRDTIVVRPTDGGGSQVDYVADFAFSGVIRWITPLLVPALERLGNETARTLAESLDRLGDAAPA